MRWPFGTASNPGQDCGHHILEVGEDMRVGQVLVRSDQFIVHINMEHAVYAGNQVEFGDVLAGSAQGLARHPGGAQGMASMLTILQTYLESVLCHVPTPWTVSGNFTRQGGVWSMAGRTTRRPVHRLFRRLSRPPRTRRGGRPGHPRRALCRRRGPCRDPC